MHNALVGFLHSSLLQQGSFESLYRSTNVRDIEGQSFDTVVCAGVPTQKCIANHEPEADREKREGLILHLKLVICESFILIITLVVCKSSIGVDEGTPVDESGLHAYGLHRCLLEKFVKNNFANDWIVRLPGLVGLGLCKNVIFDFLNDNNLDAINSRGIFQFYPMVNLWYDIQAALNAGLKLVHLTAEPISVTDISKNGFASPFDNVLTNTSAIYDMRTRHARFWGDFGHYQYSARETFQAVRAYEQSVPPTLKVSQGASA